MTYTIHVTQDDIKQGCPQEFWRCPIAHAMARAIGEPIGVRHAWYRKSDLFAPNWLPQRAVRFVDRFDAGLPVKPFQFTVETD